MRSSMAMSLNSLASKTSPHSLHSTNSLSSSRATICTRGCLQDLGIVRLESLLGGIGEGCGLIPDSADSPDFRPELTDVKPASARSGELRSEPPLTRERSKRAAQALFA